MKVLNLKLIDRFSEPVGLKIGGKDTNRTYIGALCTIIYYVATIAASIKIYNGFLDKTKPKVI